MEKKSFCLWEMCRINCQILENKIDDGNHMQTSRESADGSVTYANHFICTTNCHSLSLRLFLSLFFSFTRSLTIPFRLLSSVPLTRKPSLSCQRARSLSLSFFRSLFVNRSVSRAQSLASSMAKRASHTYNKYEIHIFLCTNTTQREKKVVVVSLYLLAVVALLKIV